MMAAEMNSLGEDSQSLLLNYFTRAEDWLYQIFKASEHQLSTGIKPRQLARIILSGLEGAILIDRVEGKASRLRAQRELVRKFFKS